MFAGAVREAVFSDPTVIRRVNAEFIPVSVGAVRLHRPPSDPEGRVLAAAGRSAPAPQGLAVLNGDGQVLAWSLTFENEAKVQAFLDETRRWFRAHPDGSAPFATRRFQRYPTVSVGDLPAAPAIRPLPQDHEGTPCPAERRLPAGTLDVQVFGRAVDARGSLVANPVNQEDYAQDRFEVTTELQVRVAETLRGAGEQRVRLPDAFARQCVSRAYLGELDVQPLAGATEADGKTQCYELWATRTPGTPDLYRVDGVSDVAAVPAPRPDGAVFHHTIRLKWEGFLKFEGARIQHLALAAQGKEVLRWTSGGNGGEPLVARLPAGRNLNVNTEVRYGFLGRPYAGLTSTAADPGGLPPLHELLGTAFLIDLPAVQSDLRLTPVQRERLRPTLAEIRGELRDLFQGGPRPDPGARIQEYRPTADRRLRNVLQQLLTPAQQGRLWEIELQQQGAFALGDPRVGTALGLTPEQRQQFQEIMRRLQQQMEAFQSQAMATGNPGALRQRMLQARQELEKEALGLLTLEQIPIWKSLLGKPLRPSNQPDVGVGGIPPQPQRLCNRYTAAPTMQKDPHLTVRVLQ